MLDFVGWLFEVRQSAAIIISVFFSIIIGTITVFINYRNTKKNRKINAAIQLNKDFYQDHLFCDRRSAAWENLKELNPKDCDYMAMTKRQLFDDDQKNGSGNESSDKSNLKINEEDFAALNRTAAFYNSMKGLIERDEVDVGLLREFFCFNYQTMWNEVRKKFLENTTDRAGKTLFREIPELNEGYKKPVLGIPLLRKKYVIYEAERS